MIYFVLTSSIYDGLSVVPIFPN